MFDIADCDLKMDAGNMNLEVPIWHLKFEVTNCDLKGNIFRGMDLVSLLPYQLITFLPEDKDVC